MKIYLLNPPFLPNFVRCGRWQGVAARGGTLYYPIWLSYAAGVLEQEFGKNIRLIDAPAKKWDLQQVKDDVKMFKPDIIVSDTNFSCFTNDASVTSELKSVAEGAKTILVGPATHIFSEKILGNDGIDAVARLEYDFTLRDYAKAIESNADLSSVTGLSYKANGKIIHNKDRPFISSEELETIPFVSKVYKEHLNINDYFLGHTLNPMVQIFTGRGCPNQCTFCSWPENLMGRKYRIRSVKNVVDEFEYIVRELPEIKEIFIEDDTFTIDKVRLKNICNEIKSRKLNITWSCNARANLDYESMKLMKSAGCRLLDVGYESGSDEILKNIKKGITTEDSRKFTRDAKKSGLMILADFIIGMPGETTVTAKKTIDFIKNIKPNYVQISIATPMPGTHFYNWAEQNGFLLVNDIEMSIDKNGFQKCIISYPDFTKNDIERCVENGLKSYYLSPNYIPVAISNIARKNGTAELSGMIKSTFAFSKYLRREK